MWMFLGAGAILLAVLNLVWAAKGKDARWFRFASMSFTALTVCAFYSEEAQRVLHEDWAGLMDIMPTMSKTLWACVIASVLINSLSLFAKQQNK